MLLTQVWCVLPPVMQTQTCKNAHVTHKYTIYGSFSPKTSPVKSVRFAPNHHIITPVKTITGWWLSHLPIWKRLDFVNWDDDIPNISGQIKHVPVTTNQVLRVKPCPTVHDSSGKWFSHQGWRMAPGLACWKAKMAWVGGVYLNCLARRNSLVTSSALGPAWDRHL